MSMDALPDELLLHVFAMVTPEQDDSRSTLRLLQLRAVSRRWRRLLQSPAAWRHRRLSLVVTQHALGCGAPALRLLPALHTLRLFLDYGSSRESRAVVQDLAASQCQIRSLVIRTSISTLTSGLLRQVIQKRRQTLQEVDLELTLNSAKSDASVILGAVADLPNLKSLALGQECSIGGPYPSLYFNSGKLNRLERLVLRNHLNPLLIMSLIVQNKDTLVEVDAGNYNVFECLALCPALRRVSVSSARDDLLLLLQRPRLDVLEVRCQGSRTLSQLSLLLPRASPPALERLRVRLSYRPEYNSLFGLHHMSAPLLERISALVVDGRCYTSRRHFLACLERMPRLEELRLDSVYDLDFETVAVDWTETTVPLLRELHVHTPARRIPRDWAPRLQARRPQLHICTDPSCGSRH